MLHWFQPPPSKDTVADLSRRGFLAGLLGVPIGSIRGARQVESRRLLSLGQFYVAGFQYYDGPDIIHQLRAGQRYELVAEPENPHDAFAVAIYWHNRQLGYIPRQENRSLSRLLQQGGKLHCQAVSANAQAAPWLALEVAVTAELSEPVAQA